MIAVISAVVIVLAMNLVGSLLITALVVFPALAAMKVCSSFKKVIITDSGRVVGVISISNIICINEYKNQLYDTIKSIWKIGPNKHKYETFIDEFYL